MQDYDGNMREISEQDYGEALSEFCTNAKVITIGDVFQIRGCRFELTKITETGIEAKAIKYSEWLTKKRAMDNRYMQSTVSNNFNREYGKNS
jgi:hypothetical protein